MRAPRTTLILRWLPALAGAAYVATVLTLWHGLVENNNWDTDAVAKLVVADRLRGSGPVHISHYGEWTTFWWLLATRWLPGHRDVWTATGYAFTLLSAALLAWATSRVAGRWAGATAAATTLIVGPFALRSFLSTTGAHAVTAFAAVLVAAVFVFVTRTTSWVPVLAGGVVTGANAASDPLLWTAGIVPFTLAAALFAWTTRRRDVVWRAGTFLVVSAVTSAVTNVVMHALDFRVGGLTVALSAPRDWPAHVEHLARELALLGGANYAIPGRYPHEPLRVAVALLTYAAVVAPVVAAVKLRRGDAVRRAYAVYWAAAVVLLCALFVMTPNAADLGPKSVNYLLTLTAAAGAAIGLLAANRRRAQLVVGVCVAFVASVNIASIVAGRAEITGVVALPRHKDAIVRVLEHAHTTRGYAGFWSAENLTWQTGMRLLVAPVNNCGAQLCPNKLFTIASWYEQRGGKTFLLVDGTIPDIHAPPFAAKAVEIEHFGRLTLYLFDYDIARHVQSVPSS